MSYNQAKRMKENAGSDDEAGGGFDVEMAEMDDNMDFDDAAILGEGPEIENTTEKWCRVSVPDLYPQTHNLAFQQIDVEHYMAKPLEGRPEAQLGTVPIIRMFGITMEGNSVCCHVHGFFPYFYLAAPSGFRDYDCDKFRASLDKIVLADARNMKETVHEAVLRVEVVQRLNILGYQGDKPQRFLKITLTLPRFVAAASRLIKREIIMSEYDFQDCQFFENNIDFDVRFMVDTDVVGCNWIQLPAGRWRLRKPNVYPKPDSRCQIEVDIAYNDFVSFETEGEWSKVAPFRILSFDLECAGRKGIFPEAKVDPVIQIANMVIRQGDPEPFIKNVFTLNSCAPIVGAQVLCFNTETVSFTMK